MRQHLKTLDGCPVREERAGVVGQESEAHRTIITVSNDEVIDPLADASERLVGQDLHVVMRGRGRGADRPTSVAHL